MEACAVTDNGTIRLGHREVFSMAPRIPSFRESNMERDLMKLKKHRRYTPTRPHAMSQAIKWLAIVLLSYSDLRAALLWNWVSEGEGNTFSGTLTTDGDYSMTLPGSGLENFKVLSFDSWFLNGTNLITSGVFEFNDWQTVGSPNLFPGLTITNSINWSRSDQKIDPEIGLTSTQGGHFLQTVPSSTGAGPLLHGALQIVNANHPTLNPSVLRNEISQNSESGGEVFSLGFEASSTVFTPVPEPKVYAGCVAAVIFGYALLRRKRVQLE